MFFFCFPPDVGIDDQSHADICDFLYGVDQVILFFSLHGM